MCFPALGEQGSSLVPPALFVCHACPWRATCHACVRAAFRCWRPCLGPSASLGKLFASLAHTSKRQQPLEGARGAQPTEPGDHQPAASPSAVVPTSGSSCLSSCLIAHQMHSSAGITHLTPSPRPSFWGPEPPAGKWGGGGLCVGFEEFSDPDGKLVVSGSLSLVSGSEDTKETATCSFSWGPLTLPRAGRVGGE